MINGIINVYKEKGFTSHDVVAKLRGILGQKKIGHTGTLDPDAVGVLPVCLGKATKLCDLLTEKDKTYEAVLKLGITTDTQDMTGTIKKQQPLTSSKCQIVSAIESFVGTYHQIPPMYSALKVNGRKLYELAREGIEIQRQPREVKIISIDLIEFLTEDEVKIMVSCSKGTYIRTLCYDIGEKLGCGGCMKELIRTRVSRFDIEDSLTLDQIIAFRDNGTLDKHIIKIEDMFQTDSRVTVLEEYNKFVYNGNILDKKMFSEEIDHTYSKELRIYDCQNQFIGLYEYKEAEDNYKPVKMFI